MNFAKLGSVAFSAWSNKCVELTGREIEFGLYGITNPRSNATMPKDKADWDDKEPNQNARQELGIDKRVLFNARVEPKTIDAIKRISSKTGEPEGRIIDRLIKQEDRPDMPFENGPDMETEERFYI